MTLERMLRLMAGVVVLVSVALIVLHDPRWLILTAFVGLNLLQSAFTDWCPAVWMLERGGWERCVPCTHPGGGVDPAGTTRSP